MRKIISGILVLVFVVTAMLITTTALAKSNKKDLTFEYDLLTGKTPGGSTLEDGVYEEDINNAAKEGWRVVQADNPTTFCAEGKDVCKFGFVSVLMEREIDD